MSAVQQPLWRPGAERVANAPVTRFRAWLAHHRGLSFDGYESLWQWSVTEPEAFWESVAEFSDIRLDPPPQRILSKRTMPGARWFEGARVNYAEHLLRRAGEPDAATRAALVFSNELGDRREITWQTLSLQAGAIAATLRSLGVEAGDRVVAYAPNIPETVSAFLGAAAIGATWSSCAPDLGPISVIDRFLQISPRVLIAVDGYRYGGKPFDRRDVVTELISRLPTIEAVIFIPYLDPVAEFEPPRTVRMVHWHDAIARPQAPAFAALPFDHPLWVVYSSGTTGMPKPIVHGHGGFLLNVTKALPLELGVGRADRMMWYSSTSWIMWNLWVAALACGSTLVHYDGNPGYPDLDTLWRFVADEKVTFFGTSPAFIGQCMKTGIKPKARFDLQSLQTLGATGSPLTDDAFRWVYDNVKDDLLLASISGGTDPGAAFLTASPILPVYAGEMQCRALGAAIAAYDEQGKPQIGGVGELVCTLPMPSMPLYFWGDADGTRYFSSYFETWPGVWLHGDWLQLIERPESVTARVFGRSDSTINRHGIRMGTSELYRVVEEFDEVADSLVVDLEYLGKPSFLALFVVLATPSGSAPKAAPDGAAAARGDTGIGEDLRRRLLQAIRSGMSARHVPDEVYAIAEVPRTLTGKKLEVPIKRILLGHPVKKAVNRDSIANPAVIDWFVAFAGGRGA